PTAAHSPKIREKPSALPAPETALGGKEAALFHNLDNFGYDLVLHSALVLCESFGVYWFQSVNQLKNILAFLLIHVAVLLFELQNPPPCTLVIVQFHSRKCRI